MSKERLSRLQKWILEFLCANEGAAWISTLKDQAASADAGAFKKKPSRKALHVTFSRSLRGLELKGLVMSFTVSSHKGLPESAGPGIDGKDMKAIGLTIRGEVKAKELLNVKRETNNKKGDRRQ